jgi:hypothetical protein
MKALSKSFCMSRPVIATAFLLTAWALGGSFGAAPAGGGQDPSHVKLTATAGKIDKDRLQVVTIKMKIDADWHAYANLVKNELLESAQSTVEIKSAKKLQDVTLVYPPGKLVKDEVTKDTYFIYEGEVEILATVKRAEGDVGPLEVKVNYMTCNDKLGKCLPAESVVLNLKAE